MMIYKDAGKRPEDRAKDLVRRLSFEDKLAQIVGFNPAIWSRDNLEKDYLHGAGQVSFFAGSEKKDIYEAAAYQREMQDKIMSLSEYRIPAIFHVETLCGAMLPGALSFPSGIGQAATFDPLHQKEVGKLIGRQSRLAGAAQAFAPVLDISRDARFGRQGETYGEDPALAAAMGSAYVAGLQQDGDLEKGVLATAKHFLGYHDSQGGIHAAACDIPERLLLEVYAKPFQAAITESGMQGIMPCYSSINGEAVSGSGKILTDLLRDEMGFDGIVVSDYCAVQEIYERQHAAESYEDAGKKALMAGISQELPSAKCYTPENFSGLQSDSEFMNALDRAVERILLVKFKLGLFENPYAASDNEIKEVYENPKHKELSLKSAKESLVLIKNNGALPLNGQVSKIAVIGHHANSTRAMFGGYTYMSMTESLLGAKNTMAGFDMDEIKSNLSTRKKEVYQGTVVEKEDPEAEKLAKQVLPGVKNLLEELREQMPEVEFLYEYGYPYAGTDCSGHDKALETAKRADLIIMTVGGKYGTGSTASIGEGIDGVDINLPLCQESFIEKAAALGIPLILIHFGGRPVSSDGADRYGDAILEAWNPGECGAQAIVEALTGKYNPGGKMPVTTPFCAGQIPIYYNHPNGSSYHQNTISAFTQYVDCLHEPRYYFGHGLSYTSFDYSDFVAEKTALLKEDNLIASLVVTNTGEYDGEEVVQIYVRDLKAGMVRPVMELCGFYRIHLKSGESKKIVFEMKQSQFAFLDHCMKWKVEAGEMELLAGSSAGDIRQKISFIITEDMFVEGSKRSFYAGVSIR